MCRRIGVTSQQIQRLNNNPEWEVLVDSTNYLPPSGTTEVDRTSVEGGCGKGYGHLEAIQPTQSCSLVQKYRMSFRIRVWHTPRSRGVPASLTWSSLRVEPQK